MCKRYVYAQESKCMRKSKRFVIVEPHRLPTRPVAMRHPAQAGICLDCVPVKVEVERIVNLSQV